MKIIRLIFTPIWKLYFLLVSITTFLVFFPLFFIFLRSRKTYKIVFFLQRVVSFIGCTLSFIFVKKIDKTNGVVIPKNCVIVANHSSYLDIVLSYFVLPNYYSFMGKYELKKVPLFREFFRDMNIAVNRKSTTDAHKAFVKAGEEIDRGNSIYIFPEGTISSKGELIKFKNGAFKLAIDKQVCILPVTYLNNWKILQNGGFFKSFGNPGIAKIVIHQPISTVGMTDENLVSLRTQVFDLINNTLNEYRKK